MSNRVCQKCGEEYSETYKTCPFCQEEEAIRQGHPPRRHSGHRESSRQGGGAGGVLLLVVGVMLAGVLGFLFFGDRLTSAVGIRGDTSGEPLPVEDSSEDTEKDPEPADADGGSGDEPVSTQPPVPSGNSGQTGTRPGAEAVVPPVTIQAGPLTLSQSDITIAAGDTARLTTTGGSGDVAWSSSNENIATVDGGSVTGQAGGTVTITAACGEESVSCTVKVTGDPWVSAAELSLSHTDVTLRESNPTFTITVKGTDSAAVWTSDNPGAATVDSSGKVTRVGGGNATITAAVDGQELTCIVRCGKA
ncbi:MAG: Ig domain-containing protein [Oscillospiraceae bacterium]|nr:Ig domain-containing protein [Oscillospiraceae bacterium]